MTRTLPSSFLRTILFIDAATCISMAVLLLLASNQIERWLMIPAIIQQIAIAILLPFAAFVAYAATRLQPSHHAVWFIIIGNAGWVAASLALLLIDAAAFNIAGKAFIGAQAAAVMLLAELEFFSLRKAAIAAA